MIKKIYGKIDSIEDGYIIVKANSVGYQVYLNDVSLGKVSKEINSELEIFIHTYVREDQLTLFGFLEKGEMEMFELLISISGIGPRAALGILNIADPKTIKLAIVNEDSSILTRVSGVGKKTAERVILELQNKIEELPDIDSEKIKEDQEVIDALLVMGYSVSEAREAVRSISKDISDISEKIKEALKSMKK